MTAKVVSALPEGPEWLYEVKLDGYRALLMKHDRQVRIRSRTRNCCRIQKSKRPEGG